MGGPLTSLRIHPLAVGQFFSVAGFLLATPRLHPLASLGRHVSIFGAAGIGFPIPRERFFGLDQFVLHRLGSSHDLHSHVVHFGHLQILGRFSQVVHPLRHLLELGHLFGLPGFAGAADFGKSLTVHAAQSLHQLLGLLPSLPGFVGALGSLQFERLSSQLGDPLFQRLPFVGTGWGSRTCQNTQCDKNEWANSESTQHKILLGWDAPTSGGSTQRGERNRVDAGHDAPVFPREGSALLYSVNTRLATIRPPCH
jgi:hypothetical protein